MVRATKAAVCVGLLLLFVAGLIMESRSVSGVSSSPSASISGPAAVDRPDLERFDAAIQKRFLTEPSFGMGRIVVIPIKPQPLRSKHVNSFQPKDGDEAELFGSFQKDGWDVGLYLYGRRAEPDERRKDPMEKFRIRYRVNEPLPITPGLEVKDLPNSKKLMHEVKSAFAEFQSVEAGAERPFEFSHGKWNFVAKPVRVMNQNCLKCHTDYVVMEKLGDGQFKFRNRQVGDVNGVLLYAYTKHQP